MVKRRKKEDLNEKFSIRIDDKLKGDFMKYSRVDGGAGRLMRSWMKEYCMIKSDRHLSVAKGSEVESVEGFNN
jgi:hypothetical protein